MKFPVCNEIFQGWIIEDIFIRAAQLGYAGVEIAPSPSSTRGRPLRRASTNLRDARPAPEWLSWGALVAGETEAFT
jgi:sugar phosphate isomerase/epimerase